MKKSLIPTGVISLVVLGLVVAMFVVNTGVFAVHANDKKEVTIHVIEHAVTGTVGDVPPAGDSLGDQLTFQYEVEL